MSAVMPPAWAGHVLRYRAAHDVPYWEQSDRPYEPFVPNAPTTDRWFDPATGVEARHPAERPLVAGSAPAMLYSATAAYTGRDTLVVATPLGMPFLAAGRRLNPWAVVTDWHKQASDIAVVDRCKDRDQWRVVLGRGTERLYLAESDATPAKLVRTEAHYLWGQVRAEYLWTTWWGVRGGGLYPLGSFRIVDGVTYERLGVRMGTAALVPADSAPRLAVPAVAAMSDTTVFPTPTPDTVRIGENLFLLVAPAYTHAVAMVRDTVFLLDATSSEARSRQDSAWIAQLFPKHRAIALVVTDLAWPHVSGVRFWVARGATIISHAASRDVLQRIVNRRWTLRPDALEATRRSATFRFVPVADSLRLAGGKIIVHALRGALVENALGVWVPAARFFWAGDYVQRDGTSPYTRDVVRTVCALGINPDVVGAQHIRPTPWSAIAIGTARTAQNDSGTTSLAPCR